jgi:hypothetical protein
MDRSARNQIHLHGPLFQRWAAQAQCSDGMETRMKYPAPQSRCIPACVTIAYRVQE